MSGFDLIELNINGSFDVNLIYLGRIDTKEVFQLTVVKGTPGIARGNGHLFTNVDIDTILPIYIGKNPPPWYDEHSGGVSN